MCPRCLCNCLSRGEESEHDEEAGDHRPGAVPRVLPAARARGARDLRREHRGRAVGDGQHPLRGDHRLPRHPHGLTRGGRVLGAAGRPQGRQAPAA